MSNLSKSIYLQKLAGTYSEVSGTREILSIFVEGHSHDTVSCVEGFLNSITVMNVNINVKHSLMVSRKIIEGFDQCLSMF